MTAQYLTIEARHRQGAGEIASLADFTVSDGDPVEPEIILTSPNVSLYCFDDATKRAIFTELPDEVDLGTVPFVYQTQYEQANRLIAVPYETFRQLGHRLPEVQDLIMIYIVGRSGSTLLSRVFGQVDHVLSLSEPDVGTQFLYLRNAASMSDAELRDLLDCTVRILFKPSPTRTPTTYVLKLRSETIRVMDLYQAAFPNARNLLSYRDALGFVTSFYRLFKKAGFPEYVSVAEFLASWPEFSRDDFKRLVNYLDPGTEQVSVPQTLTIWWMAVIKSYLRQHEKGIPALPVSYSDLNTAREQTLSTVFTYCGLPTSEIQNALRAFERDAQAGTWLAREKPTEGNSLRLSEEELAAVTRILARHPVIKSSDFVVPGTLKV